MPPQAMSGALPTGTSGSLSFLEDSGVVYSVDIQPMGTGQWKIIVGAAEPGQRVVDFASVATVPVSYVLGDAQITGRLARKGAKGRVQAVLEYIVAPHKKSGAGGRVLRVWCEVMRMLGVKTWVAESVGPEGDPFLTAMERRGLLKITGGIGDDWTVRCR
jgi:hypothetical protein